MASVLFHPVRISASLELQRLAKFAGVEVVSIPVRVSASLERRAFEKRMVFGFQGSNARTAQIVAFPTE